MDFNKRFGFSSIESKLRATLHELTLGALPRLTSAGSARKTGSTGHLGMDAKCEALFIRPTIPHATRKSKERRPGTRQFGAREEDNL